MKRLLGCIAIGLMHYPAWVIPAFTNPRSVRISDATGGYCPICHLQGLLAVRGDGEQK